MIAEVLRRAGIDSSVCATVDRLCTELQQDPGMALISDQSLTPQDVHAIAGVLHAQPPWSDLPLLVTTSGGEVTEASKKRLSLLRPFANISLLERPLRTATLVSAVRTALRARKRQYQLRDHLLERDRLLRELERSNQELTSFAHVVSHDLQAPVRMVMVYSQLLERHCNGQLDATAEGFLNTVKAGAARMEELIQTLLHYATVGQGPIAPEPVSLAQIVDAVVETLQPQINEVQARITCDELPVVAGDRILLRQLMTNLLSNALKYRQRDQIPEIRIAAEAKVGYWVVSVADNGEGIAPEHHEDVFAPLKRLHGKDIAGTGVGLAVCRKIVERHGGRIWVDSEKGRGATFHFQLKAPEGGE